MDAVTRHKMKEWAEMLFLRANYTNQEIAEKVGVSISTIGKWMKQDRWQEKKARIITTRSEELNRIYEQLNNVNDMIMSRPRDIRFANNKEADIISKLTAAARNLENDVSIANIIDVFTEYTDWLRQHDIKKAKEHIHLMDEFVKYKLK